MRVVRLYHLLSLTLLFTLSVTVTAQDDLGIITPTPPDSLPATPMADTSTHSVRPGETLFRIAITHGVSVQALATANDISDRDTIFTGQMLVIPTPVVSSEVVTPPPVTSTPLVGTVEAGGADLGIITATPSPLPEMLNDVPLDAIIVIPANVRGHIREIYEQGQMLGRDPHAFSKIGDSTIENPHFLARFDNGTYNLADYAYLQPVIDHYAESFIRQGMAVRLGLHSWSILDPFWADKNTCEPNETVIACEFRLHNPSVVLIRLGSNDIGEVAGFKKNLRQIVEYTLLSGVIPVLGTKADRSEGPGNGNNNAIREVAEDFEVPLWDFDRIAQTLPARGLSSDGIHLTTFFAHDYASPVAFQRGHAMHNLTALMMLDAIWQITAPMDESS